MADQSNRTLVCSIVFLDIVEYSKKPVTEQLALKQRFNAIVGIALAGVEKRDRIVLDTGDGAAVTFLGDPEDALYSAMAMRDAMVAQAGLAVRMGINLGPARLIKDINGQLNIIGDGINVAQRVMSFAESGQLLVSRSFYEVVSCLSSDHARLFGYVGARTDKHVRAHEVYLVGQGKRAARAAAAAPAGTTTGLAGGLRSVLAAPGPFGVQRATYLAAPLVFMLIVATAMEVRYRRDMIAEPEPIAAPTPAPTVTRKATSAPAKPAAGATKPGPATTAVAAASAKPAAAAKPAPGAKSAAAAGGTGKVQFLLQPRGGEVLVNGKSYGLSPPLQELELAAGPHTVEFRYSTARPHVERIEVRAGESIRLVHRFK